MMPLVAALLRTDLRFFVQRAFSTVFPGSEYLSNWHIDAIAHQLMRVHGGDCPRLLINQPPRSLKSLSVSVAFVAWWLGHDPSRRVIVVSYASELSAELHRQFRMVIESPWYRELFPAMRPAKDTGTELVITAGGSRYATTVGGTLTGRGAMMTGKANDYSVCTTWRMIKNDYYLVDLYRGRHQYPDLRRAVAALATTYKADAVLIEDAGPGIAMLQDLQRDTPTGMPRPIGIKPEGSKADRMAAQSFRIEAGQVHLPANAPWLDEYLLELLAFPFGKHDDQVDSTSQFLKWASSHPLFDDIGLDIISVGREDYDYNFP
ncbi:MULTISPECIES: phage terminase large subunit [unclassified Bradyrhizobium]|uniref:phage terminase large subunit n=1 Tax=unclassified Bradyrhizobium TaxID=2631580 RepID=UPI001FFAC342|nr:MULTISPECIES: phage terminase large subunit [unclassified Bradyrhizobium]MCK1711250.1 phage terminase large subunit [Bradyrhizobium sp. 143]MCK1726684.1 phage terminase large subunit [Bradyrhizobium sp. 142]